MAAEVGAQPGGERLLAHPGDELAEHRRALGVGDAVEVGAHRVGVGHVGDDGVGRGQLVLRQCPGLLLVRERDPGVGEPGRAGQRERRHVGREALVEPEVVPPAHRHQVAEPHVRHLVEDRRRPRLAGRLGHSGAEDVALGEGDAAGVLHGADAALGDEDLVVLAEGVGMVEERLEEAEPIAGDVEDLVGVEVLEERATAPDAERDAAVLGTHRLVGPGAHRVEIGGDRRRGCATRKFFGSICRNKIGDQPISWRSF